MSNLPRTPDSVPLPFLYLCTETEMYGIPPYTGLWFSPKFLTHFVDLGCQKTLTKFGCVELPKGMKITLRYVRHIQTFLAIQTPRGNP